MTADVIHIDPEFQPLPKDPKAVEVAVFDGLMIARNTRDRVMRLEAGDTEWQQAAMKRFDGIEATLRRIDANLAMLVEHMQRRTVAANETVTVRSIEGLGGK